MKSKILLSALALMIVFILSCNQTTPLQEASPASVQVSAERLARIDKALQQAVDSGWIGGAVGFIARDGKIVYNKAFGMNDPDSKTAMTPDVIFRIASQTKAVTSVAAMILFEEGKFLLDDPISKYIPEFSNPTVIDMPSYNPKDTTYKTVPAKREVTVRDLLTHTSGIDYAVIGSETMRAIYAKAGIPVGFESRKILLADKIKVLAKLPLVHQPGEKFTYGLNSDVLGYLVEIWSGMSFDKFLQQRIFEPCGMTDTYFYLPKEKQSRLATVYIGEKNKKVRKFSEKDISPVSLNYPLVEGTYFSGGAGLSSTIKDYAAFLQMLVNGGTYNGKRVLARRTVELMTMNQIGDINLGQDKFGLGFEITSKASEARLGMTEGCFSWGGYFGTFYWGDPKEKLVCLCFIQEVQIQNGSWADKFKALVYQSLDN